MIYFQEKLVKADTALEHCRKESSDLKKSITEIIPMSTSDQQVPPFSAITDAYRFFYRFQNLSLHLIMPTDQSLA
jgi:hypothetical protein